MIGQYAGESVIYGGIYSFIYFMAFISISLGLVNLFPLPVLDGGQALILTIERIIGRELPVKLLDTFYKLGGMLLIFLFVFVFLMISLELFSKYEGKNFNLFLISFSNIFYAKKNLGF